MAVLSNDLRQAVDLGDADNQRALVEWVRLLFNYAPGQCWGSPAKVTEWAKGRV